MLKCPLVPPQRQPNDRTEGTRAHVVIKRNPEELEIAIAMKTSLGGKMQRAAEARFRYS